MMVAPKLVGGLLEGSVWTGALVQAAVATLGTEDSFLQSLQCDTNPTCSLSQSLQPAQSLGLHCVDGDDKKKSVENQLREQSYVHSSTCGSAQLET